MAVKMQVVRGPKPFQPACLPSHALRVRIRSHLAKPLSANQSRSSQARILACAVPTNHQVLTRRELLQIGVGLSILASGPARADVTDAASEAVAVADAAQAEAPVPSVAEAPAAAAVAAPEPVLSPPAPKAGPQPFLDLEFQFVPPSDFKFVDTQPVYDPTRRGPAPEPSPVRARFDSPDGSTVLSVVVRNAQSIRPSLLQVTDVSVFGGLEEAARVLLPRGSKVVAASALQVVLPPRQTAVGTIEVPPKNYYRYEFTTPNGLHVVMTAAAMKGKVFVCGGSAAVGGPWDQFGGALRQATESFRLRSEGALL